jgi:hypothetical protein
MLPGLHGRLCCTSCRAVRLCSAKTPAGMRCLVYAASSTVGYDVHNAEVFLSRDTACWFACNCTAGSHKTNGVNILHIDTNQVDVYMDAACDTNM